MVIQEVLVVSGEHKTSSRHLSRNIQSSKDIIL
jgi:hypothetical protein